VLLLGCPEEPEGPPGPIWPVRGVGTLTAGAANGALDLPVGVPMGGFTGRDRALGDESGPDSRNSDYRTDFVPSGGWQTRIPAQAIWMDNGDATAVIVRLDLIYSFDGMTEAIGAKLTEATGVDVTDSVYTVTNHSHSSYGTFSKATLLFFGADFFREEIFDRIVDQAVALALEAREAAVPAAIGLGIDPLFDPVGDDAIFQDRREENNALPSPDGEYHANGWKDERATMLRIDSVDGDPIAALFAFGIHGTVMGGGNDLITSDAPGHIATLMNERHGGPLWMFAQGAGGDASPGGRFSQFARMEWIAEEASHRLLALYDSIELTSSPIALEPVQRYVRQGRDIRVTRNDTVDFHYLPWDPAWADDPFRPDLRVWNDQACDDGWFEGCEILSPLDEFWSQHGAALCGEPDIDISLFGLDVPLPMYASCLDVDKGFSLFKIAFRRYIESRDDFPLPLPESRTTLLGAIGLGQIPVTTVGEGVALQNTVLSFAPGEVTTLWAESLRHRSTREHAVEQTMVIGYALDHEGYLLTVEDWMQAGYEASIMWWGPLQGEHILERLLEVNGLANSGLKEDPNYPDFPTETWYPDWDTPFVEPDATPNAGVTVDPIPPYIFTRDGVLPTVGEPGPIQPRIQGLPTWTFEGSDPATGLLSVTVERDVDGQWEKLTTPTGLVRDELPDFIIAYTPLPLNGTSDDPDPLRDHLYHVEWQTVNTTAGLDQVAALPLGNYRFHVAGASRDPADSDYPYDTIAWEATSQPFELVPAETTVEVELDGTELRMEVGYAATPRGFRLLHMDSEPTTATPWVPHPDGVFAVATDEDGAEVQLAATLTGEGPTTSAVLVDVAELGTGAWTVVLDDGWGNTASTPVLVP